MKPGRIEPENFPVQHQGYPRKALEKVLLDLYKGPNNPFKGYPVTNLQVTDIKIIIVVNKIMEDSQNNAKFTNTSNRQVMRVEG